MPSPRRSATRGLRLTLGATCVAAVALVAAAVLCLAADGGTAQELLAVVTGLAAAVVVGGVLAAVARTRAVDDELGALARELEAQTGLVQQAQDELRRTNDDFEEAVAARTHDLAEDVAQLRHGIANHRQARELLARLQRRQELILNSAGQGIVGVNAQGSITFVNPAASELLGQPELALLARNIHDAVHGPSDHEARDCPLVGSVRDGKATSGTEVIRRSDAPERSVEFSSRPIEEAGEITGGVIVLEDVTERLRLERQVQMSQKLESIGLLAGGIAHDVNNVLMAISGSCEILLKELEDDRSQSELSEIIRATQRASSVTRKVLAFTRQQPSNPRPMSLSQIVAGMEPMLRRLLPANVRVEALLDDRLEPAKVDPDQIEQVVLNLVLNARDAIPDGGTITIETRMEDFPETRMRGDAPVRPGRYARLRVSDTGVGMDAETQARVFEPFFSTKPAGEGTGLGLATAYGIVKQSDGYIVAHSAPGEGTTFELFFPRTQDEAPTLLLRAVEPPPRTEGTVLVVDDDPGVLRVLRELLEHRRFEIHQAASEDEAIAVADRVGTIDVLITDLGLPGKGGDALANELVARRPELEVVFISGFVGSEPPTLVRAGHAVLLEKPFGAAALTSAIETLLEHRRRPQASTSSTALAS